MKNMTIKNSTNKTHDAFMNATFEKIVNEIRKDKEYQNKVIVMSQQSKGVWTIDTLGLEILFEDIDRNDIQFVSIRKV